MPNARYFMKFFEHNQCVLLYCCVHLDVIVSFYRPFFLSLFHFLLSFLIHLIDIHAHLSTSQSLLIRTIGTILYNKITKLVYRRINCTLYEYVWCSANEKETKEMIFFSSFNSLSIYFISRWLVSKRLGCAVRKLFSAVLLNFVLSALGFF